MLPFKCMKPALVLVKDQRCYEIGKPPCFWGCFRLLSLTPPLPAFTGFLWTPADCIVTPALFKQMSVRWWLLVAAPLSPFVINMEQHTPLGEGTESLLPVLTCATWKSGVGGGGWGMPPPPFEKLATTPFFNGTWIFVQIQLSFCFKWILLVASIICDGDDRASKNRLRKCRRL